jgi:ABC-type glycerol-3-phosphate transport system permease component
MRLVARPVGMALAALVFLLPFAWTLSTSLKQKAMILQVPPAFLPWPPTLENYANVFSSGFLRYLMNSSIVALCTVLVVVVISIHAGYAVARFTFRGKAAMLFLILIGMAMGEFSTVLPLYFFGSRLGLLDTYGVLVLANSAFIAPLAIWFMQGYFHSIPIQIEEAALIDGASRLGALYQVVVPSAGPGLITVALISFVQSWNEFILALVLTSSGSMRTVSVGMHLYMTDYGIDWGNITAAGVISIVPILILFVFMQRHLCVG